jgi:hypothetical protein
MAVKEEQERKQGKEERRERQERGKRNEERLYHPSSLMSHGLQVRCNSATWQ